MVQMIPSEIEDFLLAHRVSVLSVSLGKSGVHAATLHFSFQTNPFMCYFSTAKESRKCTGLLDGSRQDASLVIGFREGEWVTFQADGTISLVSEPDKLRLIRELHYQKFPESITPEDDPETVFLEFVPQWWRFTDFTQYPIEILTSEDE